MNDLIRKIRGWASARNLIKGSTTISQFAKLTSEVGEIAAAIPQNSHEAIMDGIGDAFVVLVIICSIAGIDMEECCKEKAIPLAPSKDSNITDPAERMQAQSWELLWLMVTLGKLGDALLKKDDENTKARVKDALSSLSLIGMVQGSSLHDCTQSAYEEIRDRKGVMFNGTFIKSTDNRYSSAVRELGLEAEA